MSYFVSLSENCIISKKRVLKIPFFLMVMFSPFLSFCQDVLFNQTFFSIASVNPGAAGKDTSNLYDVTALNRNYISGFDGAPVTTLINVEGPIRFGGRQSGITVNLLNDKAGFLRNTNFGLGYAYRLKAGKGSLGIGLTAGMLFGTINPEGWRPPDGGTDPAISTEKSTKKSFDAGAGLYYEESDFFAGVSLMHITGPQFIVAQESSKLKPTLYVNGGYNFYLFQNDIKLMPTLLVMSDLATTQYEFGATGFYRDKFWAGLNYRFKSSVGLLAGLNLFPSMKLGYCFSYNTAILGKFSSNHEVMLNYRFAVFFDRGKQKYKSVRYL